MSRLIVTLSWDTWTKPPLMLLVYLQLSHLCWFMSVSCVSRGFSSSPQWGRMYPMGPQVLSKRKWKPLEWISGRSVTLNTDLKPMPFCPVISGDQVASHIQYILWWLPTMSLDLHILISFKVSRTYLPMYPYLCLPLVLRPTSQMALMLLSWKPVSLLRMVMQFLSTTKASAGMTPASDG